MRNAIMLSLLASAALFIAADNHVLAQQQSSPPSQQQASQQPTQAEPEAEAELKPAEIETPAAAPAGTDLILADIDPEATQTEDLLRNGRFIPTEEISQDLGVSFPVDI